MTDTPMAVEVNCETGEVIERPLTAEEISARVKNAEAHAILIAEREAEAQVKADARLAAQAKLQALGLTGEEVAALTNEVNTDRNAVITDEDIANLLKNN
jgi:hypothetical protein